MFDDPIVEDVRRVRHAHASQFDNDLPAIVANLAGWNARAVGGMSTFRLACSKSNQHKPECNPLVRRRRESRT